MLTALCESLFERQLKRLFIRRSVFVRDNGAVKNFFKPFALGPARRAGESVRTRWRVAPRQTRRWVASVGLALGALGLHGGAVASDKGDHERALQAVQSGQVLPLAKVLSLLEREHPGQVLEVELENEQQQWQYEIKLLQPDGRLMKLKLDARTGEVLKRQTRRERR